MVYDGASGDSAPHKSGWERTGFWLIGALVSQETRASCVLLRRAEIQPYRTLLIELHGTETVVTIPSTRIAVSTVVIPVKYRPFVVNQHATMPYRMRH